MRGGGAIAAEPETCAGAADEAIALCGGGGAAARAARSSSRLTRRARSTTLRALPPPRDRARRQRDPRAQIALMKACAGATAGGRTSSARRAARRARWRRRVSTAARELVHACARARRGARARARSPKRSTPRSSSAAIWASATAAAEHPPFVELALQSWRDARAANVAVGRGGARALRACLAHGADAAAEEVLAQQGADGGLDLLHSLAWRDEIDAALGAPAVHAGGREEIRGWSEPRAVAGRGR